MTIDHGKECDTFGLLAPSTQVGPSNRNGSPLPPEVAVVSFWCDVKAKPKKAKAKRPAPRWTLAACPVNAPARELWRPEWRDHATSLLVAYNAGLLNNPTRQRAADAGHGRVVLRGTEDVLEALYAVRVWAKAQGIEPVAWVRWNGRRVRTADSPIERLLCLFDADRVATYREDAMTSVNEADAQDAALHARLGASGFVPGRDLHAGAELAKAHFLERGREILCLDAHDITHGFHAASTSCLRCPLRDRCKAETAFRLGKDRA